MSWVRLDDGFAQHPKVAGLSDRAFRAHVEALCYCASYMTAGRIPAAAFRLTGATPRVRDELLSAGVWDELAGELHIHDWLIYNGRTTAEKVAAFLENHPDASGNDVYRAIGGKREDVQREVARFHAVAGSTPVPGNHSGADRGGSPTGRTRAVPSPSRPRRSRTTAPAPAPDVKGRGAGAGAGEDDINLDRMRLGA